MTKLIFVLLSISFLKILLTESNTQIVSGANTSSKINFSAKAEAQELNLTKSVVRWITGDKKVLESEVRTFLHYIILPWVRLRLFFFDGEIQMSNSEDAADSKEISKKQWGGIGGRFKKNYLRFSRWLLS